MKRPKGLNVVLVEFADGTKEEFQVIDWTVDSAGSLVLHPYPGNYTVTVQAGRWRRSVLDAKVLLLLDDDPRGGVQL